MSKIILAQIDTVAGDIFHNSAKIKETINKAKEKNANMVIFPELALFGYPFGDIFARHKSLIKFQLKELEEIKKLTNNITALVGYVEPTNSENKKPYYNSIAILQNGKQISTVRKKLLPSYCEFNDNRYFEPSQETGEIIEIENERYGIIVCEDGFNDKDFFEHNIYMCDPIEELMKKKPTTIINCSSSPSRARKEQLKHNLLSSIAKKYKVNYIYVNQAGYGDNLCFDGASRIYDSNGNLKLRGKFFEEDFIEAVNFQGKIENIPKGLEQRNEIKDFSLDYFNDLDRTYQTILCGIRGYFRKTGFQKAVLGLSGGLDSSVCAVLLADALGKENVYGISMPTKITSLNSKKDAQILANNLGIHFLEIPINKEIEIFSNELKDIFRQIDAEQYTKSTTFENIQARSRATILWSISNECKFMLPIATSDKSELYIGYATINGDMSGGFAPIADVTKTKLFALADFLNTNRPIKNVIPKNILEKPPGAELKFDEQKGRTVTAEEDNMPYPFLDEIIWFVENRNYGYEELKKHKFKYETNNLISQEQKESWILKFFDKSQKALFKWHILPPSIIVDAKSINITEYHHPIISKYSMIG